MGDLRLFATGIRALLAFDRAGNARLSDLCLSLSGRLHGTRRTRHVLGCYELRPGKTLDASVYRVGLFQTALLITANAPNSTRRISPLEVVEAKRRRDRCSAAANRSRGCSRPGRVRSSLLSRSARRSVQPRSVPPDTLAQGIMCRSLWAFVPIGRSWARDGCNFC